MAAVFVDSHRTNKQCIIVVLWVDINSFATFSTGQFLNDSILLRGIRDIMGNIQPMLASKPKLVSVKSPSLGCSHGYRLDLSGAGCRKCWSSGRHWLNRQTLTVHFLFSLSRLSCWDTVHRGGVQSLSTGDLSGSGRERLLPQVSQGILPDWCIICQAMWVHFT